MINYSESLIFSNKTKKCLSFDPFHSTFELAFNNPKKSSMEEIQKQKKEYYNCSEKCFDLYDNLPLFNFHYEIACLCINKCFNNIKSNSTID